MKTIAINQNNDIYLDSNNNLALKKDLNAMGDILINKSQTNMGELLFNNQKGIDFFNTVFSSPAYPDLFQHQLLNQFEDTQAVEEIIDFRAQIKNNIYSYKANIQTEFGEVILNG